MACQTLREKTAANSNFEVFSEDEGQQNHKISVFECFTRTNERERESIDVAGVLQPDKKSDLKLVPQKISIQSHGASSLLEVFLPNSHQGTQVVSRHDLL